ncbi:MAG: DEAD/DEAH box helicase [Clostridiales bacterium]|jgi:hypothetical protein|nr:DEAD/DEAH box helicase [Clostridiales bacterium]
MKCFLDKNQIERLASNKKVYEQGCARYASGEVGELDFSEEGGHSRVSAFVRSSGDRQHLVSIVFDEGGILQKYSCSCDAYGVWRGGCDHVVAALLKIFDQNRQLALLSHTSRVSHQLLGIFEKRAYEEADRRLMEHSEPASPLRIEPVFGCTADRKPVLSLEIGFSRMYVVKSVTGLLAAFENEQVLTYGKNLEIKHSVTALDKQSRELYQLLKSEYARLMYRTPYYNIYRGGGQSERFFSLTPQGLDAFFILFAGREIAASGEVHKSRTVELTEAAPDSKMSLVRAGNGLGATLCWEDEEALTFMPGEEYGYILRGKSLHRLGLDSYNVLREVCRAYKSVNARTMTFIGADMKRFSAFVLPMLRRHGFIDANGGDEILPEMKPRAYLDAENGGITLVPAFLYGEKELRPGAGDETDVPRDITGEYAFVKAIELMGFRRDAQSAMYFMEDDDSIFEFYHSEHGLPRLKELAEVFATDAFSMASRRPSKTPAFGLRLSGNLLEVDIDPGDFDTAELLAVLESHRLKKKYHKLKDGRFVDFADFADTDELDSLDSLLAGLDVTQKDLDAGVVKAPKYRALYMNSALTDTSGLQVSYIDEGVRKLAADFKDFKEVDFPVPAVLEPVLRSYQKEGFRWLMTLSNYGFGGILADDMGLGKTIQVIAVLLDYIERTPKGERLPSMVVAPTSLIYNWEKEIHRFAPGIETMILSGTAAKRREDFNGADADVFITTYDMLKRDAENYRDTEFRYVVADEAQNIKNPGTQNAKAVKALNAQLRLALTGTPIENALYELWSIFDFVMPGYLLSAARFTKVYEAPILKNDDKAAAGRLRRQIAPFILRRLKADVLAELPEKVETTLYADMTEEQRKVYLAYLLKAKGEMEETVRLGRFNESQIAILSMLTRLRQICCHPATFIEDYAGGSGKLDLTAETVKSALESGHRILVFSQFTKMLAILMERLDAVGVSYYYLDGATPSKERLNMTEAFNGGSREAFLISLKAGGSGLNLTGADVVIHYDPWWNPAVMSQASDRAHRFGQKRAVQVINIVSKDSIEEKIIALQSRKKDLVDAVIEEGTSFINKLTQEEIIELFRS